MLKVESEGMRKEMIGMKKDSVEDIIEIVEIYSKGKMEKIKKYNERKNGEEEIE